MAINSLKRKDYAKAIAEAKAQLAETKVRAAKLKCAIRHFTEQQKECK